MRKILAASMSIALLSACSKENVKPSYMAPVVSSLYNGVSAVDSAAEKVSIVKLSSGFAHSYVFAVGAYWDGYSLSTISQVAVNNTYTFKIGSLWLGVTKLGDSAILKQTINKIYVDSNYHDRKLFDASFTISQNDSIIGNGQIKAGLLEEY